MPRTIFISDALSSVGRASAVRLGRAGWNLVLGGSSLSGLKDICAELPHPATLPMRCEPNDIENVEPVLEAGLSEFGVIDAVLMCNRPRRGGWRRVIDMQVLSLAVVSEAARPYLRQSGGHFVIAGSRAGNRSMKGAAQTITQQAAHTIADALSEEWRDEPVQVSLIEPRGLGSANEMARRIARALNGAPPQRFIERRIGALG